MKLNSIPMIPKKLLDDFSFTPFERKTTLKTIDMMDTAGNEQKNIIKGGAAKLSLLNWLSNIRITETNPKRPIANDHMCQGRLCSTFLGNC
jgi:hypothetical protein